MDIIEYDQLANWLTRCRAIVKKIDTAQDYLQPDLPLSASENLDYAKQETKALEREINLRVKVLHTKLQNELPLQAKSGRRLKQKQHANCPYEDLRQNRATRQIAPALAGKALEQLIRKRLRSVAGRC